MVKQDILVIATQGRSTIDISCKVQALIRESGIVSGICNLLIQHTSASLMLCENADPDVRHDLETFMSDLIPDGDSRFRHQNEGIDDMPAHIRTILTNPDLTIPVSDGQCGLGNWQSIYLWEHRAQSNKRRVMVTIYGE